MPPLPSPDADARDLHLVVYGATGFTGRLVADYLASAPASARAEGEFRWGIAGRDRAALERVRAALGLPDLPCLVADAHDPAALRAMCARTRAVVTTVGPYARHGLALVGACVDARTHYADLSGEVTFMRRTIDAYHRRAAERGVRIVHSCGFDSIPSELGVIAVQEEARRRHGRFCGSVQMALLGASGSFSGGTFASLFGVLEEAGQDRHLRALVDDPFALNPAGRRGSCGPPDFPPARYDAAVGRWLAPFVMASINTRVVRRGEALLGWPSGKTFCYAEATATGPGLAGRAVAGAMGAALRAVMRARPGGALLGALRRLAPAPGEGPDAEARERGYFEMLFVGRDPGEVRVVLRGRRDPGYGCTSRLLGECGIALARGEGGGEVGGGVLTPRVAFGGAGLVGIGARAGVGVVP